MAKRKGRAYRRRKRRGCMSRECKGAHAVETGANISHESDYVQLRKWLKKKGFNDFYLVPANFPDIGRGLMTIKALQPGDLVIRLPEKCLLTANTALKSYLGEYIERWKPCLSALQALCTFLISERHFGNQSAWKPYIDVLPKTYSCPVYLAEEVIDLFPGPLVKKIQEQKSAVRELYLTSQCFFSSLQPLFSQHVESIFTYDAFRWAWCSVNTRTVYMEHVQSEFFSQEPDVYALAPYLDLLNHSPSAQVAAAFNQKSSHYEIRTVTKCRQYEQVFICYGPHDNQRLLLEYGFLASSNPHSVVYVDKDLLCNHISQKDESADRNLLFIQGEGLLENLTFGLDGPSWRLMTVLKLFCLRAEEYLRRKNILVGLPVSAENEWSSLELAEKLCFHLISENQKVMHEISKLLHEIADLSEQLELVATLRREELKILQASAEVLQNMRFATPR
ncbi:SET domain-containing protein 4 isoform X1 [Carcharodon carcharias]|uniref:SET domain-containing protein 4 isoform X1 n=2 Tax=Carcharodon carcharias TaxID=13397 RepID=UPI001B7DB208|nr:SET domain-containing protein 4 isoform X1 [Carcharodon carcharias]